MDAAILFWWMQLDSDEITFKFIAQYKVRTVSYMTLYSRLVLNTSNIK